MTQTQYKPINHYSDKPENPRPEACRNKSHKMSWAKWVFQWQAKHAPNGVTKQSYKRKPQKWG